MWWKAVQWHLQSKKIKKGKIMAERIKTKKLDHPNKIDARETGSKMFHYLIRIRIISKFTNLWFSIFFDFPWRPFRNKRPIVPRLRRSRLRPQLHLKPTIVAYHDKFDLVRGRTPEHVPLPSTDRIVGAVWPVVRRSMSVWTTHSNRISMSLNGREYKILHKIQMKVDESCKKQ